MEYQMYFWEFKEKHTNQDQIWTYFFSTDAWAHCIELTQLLDRFAGPRQM